MSYLPYDILVMWTTPLDPRDIDAIEIYKGPSHWSCQRIIDKTVPIHTTNEIHDGEYIDQLNRVGTYKYVAIARNSISTTECGIKTFKVYPDKDKDGIPDNKDEFPRDYDNDGVPDYADTDFGMNYLKGDNDADGIIDKYDPDDDNDGIPDELDIFPFFKNRQLIVKHENGVSYTGVYPDMAKVEVSANGNFTDGFEFKEWEGEVSDPYSEDTIVLMDKDKEVTAFFGEISYDLEMDAYHLETQKNPGVVNLEGAGSYERNETIEVKADIKNPCFTFIEWSGSSVFKKFSTTTKVRMDSRKKIFAIVDRLSYRVTVTSQGFGDSRDGQLLYDEIIKCGDIASINIVDQGGLKIEGIYDSSGKIVPGGEYSFIVQEDRLDLIANFST
jgi:hypothetical protein